MQALLFSISNAIVSFTNLSFLGYTWDPDLIAEHPWIQTVLDPILELLNNLLLPILIVVGTAGSIYAIVLGVNFARAETSDKREEAKKRMVNAIVGIVAMIFLLILLQLFVANADSIVQTITGFGSTEA